MNLHEYQAKELLLKAGLPVLRGVVVNSVEQALLAVDTLNTPAWVVKAQVHAGGRGKAGGIKVVSDKTALETVVHQLLNTRLVTYQTTAEGQPVNQVLIEETANIEKELYVGAVIDRTLQKVVFMASTEGGVEIEKVAMDTPDKIIKIEVDPYLGVLSYQCRFLAKKLQLSDTAGQELTALIKGLYQLMITHDLSLIEINPLVLTKEGHLICLDAKMNVDDNGLYRQPLLQKMRDTTQEEPREILAKKWELNYVSLKGSIGCMVNGAGLAMATMDLIKLEGGDPANFLDVGGGATEERVQEAFKIILSDPHVKAVLVNIFGGIVRCDFIAEGIIRAVSEVGIKVPVVVRLEGNHATEARVLLDKSDLNIITGESLKDAAQKVVKAAGIEK